MSKSKIIVLTPYQRDIYNMCHRVPYKRILTQICHAFNGTMCSHFKQFIEQKSRVFIREGDLSQYLLCFYCYIKLGDCPFDVAYGWLKSVCLEVPLNAHHYGQVLQWLGDDAYAQAR